GTRAAPPSPPRERDDAGVGATAPPAPARRAPRLGSLTERGTGGFGGRGMASARREAPASAPGAKRAVAAPPTRSPSECPGSARSLCTQPPSLSTTGAPAYRPSKNRKSCIG